MVETKKVEVIYTVKEKTENWDDTPCIKSNIEEPTVTWKISKSLSETLLKESATRKPDLMLLEYAELQKRNLQNEIEGLSDLELTILSKTKQISDKLDKVLDEQIRVFENKHSEIFASINKFENEIKKSADKLNDLLMPVNNVKEFLGNLNTYEFKNFFELIGTIENIHSRNPKLLEFITTYFKK